MSTSRRIPRRLLLAGGCALAFHAACSSWSDDDLTPRDQPELVGRTSLAITDTLDPDNDNSYPIVQIRAIRDDDMNRERNCSATFVTPRLLLTAGHCLQYTKNVNNILLSRPGLGKVVRAEVLGNIQYPEQDAALLFLETSFNPWLEVDLLLRSNIRKPWTVVPPLAGAQASGFNFALTDRYRGAAVGLTRFAGYWQGTAPELVPGNSGGPLFTTDATTGARTPFGVSLEFSGALRFWWDATAPANRAWLEAKAADVTRSRNWRQGHGWGTTEWYGQVDYAGACDTYRDPDCDRWYTEHDNCRGTYNPAQEDSDDDGVGDACDNCILTQNSDQANCNEAAEQALLKRAGSLPSAPPTRGNNYLRGDACDPVPCAAAESAGREFVDTTCVRVDQHDECTSRTRRSTFSIPTLGSATSVSADQKPHVTVVPGITTHFRFCQDARKFGYDVNCRDPILMVNGQIRLAEVADKQDSPWHRIRVGGGTAKGATRVWDYGQTATALRWLHEADTAEWVSTNPTGIVFPPACTATNKANCLDGTFWVHADTTVGKEERHLDDLPNRFIYSKPEGGTIAYCPMLPEGVVPITSSLLADPSPVGEIALSPGIRIALAAGVTGENPRPGALAVPIGAAFRTKFGPVGALRDDGKIVPLGAKFAPEGVGNCSDSGVTDRFATYFDQPRWASVVDPNTWSSKISTDFAAVGLKGTDVYGMKLKNEQLDILFDEEEVKAAGSAPAIENPTVVLSRAAGGFFVLGGTDRWNGTPVTKTWFHPLPGPWVRLRVELSEGEIVSSATYSFADHRLWAMVRNSQANSPWTLVRFDLGTGSREKVYQFTYGSGARPILSVDRDGAILVSMARTLDTRQARFWDDGGVLRAQRVSPIAGLLHRPLVIDAVDYAIITEVSGKLAVTRQANLTSLGTPVTCPCDNTFGEQL